MILGGLNMKAIILAAGYATRLYPLTENFPKHLLTISKDKTIIDYVVDSINTVDEISDIYVVTNAKYFSMFEKWAQKKKNIKPIKVINDGTDSVENRLGAIGDILFTVNKEKINDDLSIIAGDNLFDFNFLDYYKFFKKKNAPCVHVINTKDIKVLKACAVASLDNNRKITEIEEKPAEPKSNYAVTAIYFYPKIILKEFDKYKAEGHVMDAPGYFVTYLYKKTPVYAYEAAGDWFDVGTVESLESVRELYSKK
jgi:glucose-1-phosphate thymidylyltransferase